MTDAADDLGPARRRRRRSGPSPHVRGRVAVWLVLSLLGGVLVAATPATPASAVSSSVRHAGADRYATAVALSEAFFDPGVPVVYVATGRSFADALAGAPAAARDGAPLLLTTRTLLPTVTADELDRLDPGEIVVLGGDSAVGGEVVEELEDHTTGTVRRVAGDDRVSTAAEVASDSWPDGADTVYVANGLGFADALAGGAAAAADDAPVLLTAAGALPATTREELSRLAPDRIWILGGTAAVDRDVEHELEDLAGAVGRRAGTDRYATSAEVASGVFERPLDTVVVTTGVDFADALAAGAAAGTLGAPVVLSTRDCVPVDVAEAVRHLEVDEVVVVGGTGVLSSAIEEVDPCSPLPDRPRFVVRHLHPDDVDPVDRDQAIRAEVTAVQNWLVGETGDRQVRFDRVDGQLAVETVELPLSSDEVDFESVAQFLHDEDVRTDRQYVLAYVDAEETGSCGRGVFGVAVYWNESCGPPSTSTSPDDVTVVSAISIHEILHALGAVPDCAPNAHEGHVVDDSTDIMTAELTSLDDLVLDFGRDDYYGHGDPDCLDIADSGFLELVS